MAVAAPSKPFTISFTKTKAPSASKLPGTRKRPHWSIVEEDSDNEDKPPKAQLVSAFDHSVGGAIAINDVESNKGPLIIQSQKNHFWREGSLKKQGKNLLPAEVQAARIEKSTQKTSAETDQAPQTWGLSFAKPQATISDGGTAEAGRTSADRPEAYVTVPHTEDDEAMDALLGNSIKKSTLILPVTGNHNDRMDAWLERGNEDDRFKTDVASRPDAASLDEYAAVPVEEFGPAMLRGMGWKEGDAVGSRKSQSFKPREVARRPALLGIGAKEMPGGVEELGAWGSAAKAKRKADEIYNPVMLKNSVTGEIISEEELEKRKQNDSLEERVWKERRDKNLALDSEKKERRKHAAEDSLERINRSRRHRSKSAERRHHLQIGTETVRREGGEADLTTTLGTAPRVETGVDRRDEAIIILQDGPGVDRENGGMVVLTMSGTTNSSAIGTGQNEDYGFAKVSTRQEERLFDGSNMHSISRGKTRF